MTETPEFDSDPNELVYMNETDPEIIAQQLRDGFAAEENDPYAYLFLNNFHANMPNDMYRKMFERMNFMDSRFIEEDDGQSRMSTGELKYSLKARDPSMTFRRFFEDVDAAVLAAGLDPVEIERLRAAKEAPGRDIEATQRDYQRYIAPAYVQLRIQGYSHSDLVR